MAVIADIDQDHRDFIRFLWFKDNEPSNDIVEYRMKVHVFGHLWR